MPRSDLRLGDEVAAGAGGAGGAGGAEAGGGWTAAPRSAPLAELLAAPPGAALRIHWLGQAGFVIDGAGRRVVIDPYLSDCLAEKYRGKPFDHQRMMPAPVRADEIRCVDMVVSTHAHTDHLDPGALPQLMAGNPTARLLAPEASREIALGRAGIGADRFIGIDAGGVVEMPGLRIVAVRAAHEALETDDAGRHRFLGYGITLGDVTVFHSGDTVPFAGQLAEVAALGAAIALLPVNGRRAELAAAGVPGNLTMAEAVALVRGAGIPAMIGHHFDMFAFNTVPRAEVERAALEAAPLCVMAARVDRTYLPGRNNDGKRPRDE
ncbi:MBL fold metallo-hydrolase [Frigidibacter sp. MR17.24]|uniref:MBL fold metallo-hydrolase n=1 Tax=Frigidibacter sp. MR17.24 TaxID=3127345 RepID=UPI003012B5F3